MGKRVLITVWVILLTQSISSQVIFQEPLSPRNANYNFRVTLDPLEKTISGHETLIWRNITDTPAQDLQFHLYINAFRNNRSTYYKEKGRRGGFLEEVNGWGWVNVDSIFVNGEDVTESMTFIHPDDDNEDDKTVILIPLDRPVQPGREITVDFVFRTRLPRAFERTGYYKDFFFAAQWFPKIGVFEDGEWNCHQYHAAGEFFADYGVYDLELTLPSEYIVGSTGVLGETQLNGDLKTWNFHAEDVHDFTWTAWPSFLEHIETHRGVEIRLLYESDHSSSVERIMDAMRNTIDFMSEWVGGYPYPIITVLNPPTGCMGVGGMEYPMLITAGSFWQVPAGLRFPELVTLHEFGHNYWYGIVGNNETEEAWLDEGFTTYTEIRITDKYYGEDTGVIDFAGLRIGSLAGHRMRYIGMPRNDRTLRNAWTYIGGGYGTMSYSKPGLMLVTLENIIGRPVMDEVMRTFFQQWKFKHPKSQDFIDIVNEVTGEDYTFFFDQALRNSLECDYTVTYAGSRKIRKDVGHFEEGEKQDSEEDDEIYRTYVKVHRRGEFILPVDIRLTFENGETTDYVWDGEERWVEYEIHGPRRIKSAEVDPDRKIVLDSNYTNNSYVCKPQKKAVQYLSVRFLYWFQTALHLFGFFS